jgi:hypothetical protein
MFSRTQGPNQGPKRRLRPQQRGRARRLLMLCRAPVIAAALVGAVAWLALAGPGSVDGSPASRARSSGGASSRVAYTEPTPGCVATVDASLGRVALNLYETGASGPLALYRFNRALVSAPLVSSIASEDVPALLIAMQSLRVPYMSVARHGEVLARLGHGPAIGPISGTLRMADGRAVGQFTLASHSADDYAYELRRITGAEILLYTGSRLVTSTLSATPPLVRSSGRVTSAGVAYHAVSIRGHIFPAGPLRITLLVPSSAYADCANSAAKTEIAVLGQVAQRVYDGELGGPEARSNITYMESSPAFVRAVAIEDPRAIRTAIVSFFRSHRHIVRVRVLKGSRVIYDLGGPYALAPVTGHLRSHGHPIGRFITSVQDDNGFVLLAREYTGAQLILRANRKQLPNSTMARGPARLPKLGTVTYDHRTYATYSFPATRFPSGPLRISVLMPVHALAAQVRQVAHLTAGQGASAQR